MKKITLGVSCQITSYMLHNCPFIDSEMFIQVIHTCSKGAGAALVKALSACPHTAGLTQSKGSESQRASEGLKVPVVENRWSIFIGPLWRNLLLWPPHPPWQTRPGTCMCVRAAHGTNAVWQRWMELDHTAFSNKGSRDLRAEGDICIKRQREKRWRKCRWGGKEKR